MSAHRQQRDVVGRIAGLMFSNGVRHDAATDSLVHAGEAFDFDTALRNALRQNPVPLPYDDIKILVALRLERMTHDEIAMWQAAKAAAEVA